MDAEMIILCDGVVIPQSKEEIDASHQRVEKLIQKK